MTGWRSRLRVALALALVMASSSAFAETEAELKARAFATFERGEAQFKDGSFDAAAQLFQRAWSTWKDPAYLFNIGLAFEKAERWPLAVEWYARFLETYPDVPNVSEVRRRHAAAMASREATRAEVAIVTEPAGARVELTDAAGVATCTAPCSLRVDAGPITVRAFIGKRVGSAARSLAPGERWDLALVLADAAKKDPQGAPPVDPTERIGAIVSWSVGGVALATGVVFGVMASDSHEDGRSLAQKNGGVLERDDYDRLRGLREDVERESLIADIGFGTAVAGAIIGTIWWLASEPDVVPGRAAWRF